MKITSMRNREGKCFNAWDLSFVMTQIDNAMYRAGFVTEVSHLTKSSIKVGMHKKCFTIDTNKHGYNARFGAYVSTKSGYRRTNIPTWKQRVAFNDILNDILDEFGVSCNIKSGMFTIRDKNGRKNEQYWIDQLPEWMGSDGQQYNASMGTLISHIKRLNEIERPKTHLPDWM